MKRALLDFLVCRDCGGGFDPQIAHAEGEEILDGKLICRGCRAAFPILRGIPRFLPNRLSNEQSATVGAFGYEWTHYSQLTEADRGEFLAWIDPLKPSDFEDRVVLDGGCGKGRHIFLASQFKARTVIGVDLSDAVEAAYRNTRDLDHVHVIQADLCRLPFGRPFDLAYSIGVLHHLPSPAAGFQALAGHVHPGGRVATWVYGKEGNGWIERFVDPVRKNVTSRTPPFLTRCFAFLPATVLYGALKLLYLPARKRPGLKRLLPYSSYLCSISGYAFAENFWNVFDQLVAPTAFYHSREEVEGWYAEARAKEVRISRHNGNSWRGTAVIC